MNILFLSHKFYPDVGGVESNSEILANAFSKAGHSVRVMTWSLDSTQKSFEFAVVRNPSKTRLFREHSWADVVLENNPCLRLSWPGLFLGKRSVVVLNTWISRANGNRGVQDYLKLLWLKRAKRVIAVSDAIRKRCWASATVIQNPYRAEEFTIDPNIARTTEFAFLGRLVSDKGADQAIHAIHRLVTSSHWKPQSQLKTILTIIGDGPDRGKLQSMVQNLGLSDVIHFTGSLQGKELTDCLNRHCILLVPSVWEEPFGNVALEGMACGCIPIVSDGGGLPDAIGQAGITFARNDVSALINGILELRNNVELVQRLRYAAKAHLATHHPDLVAHRYLDVITEAVNKT